MSRKNLLLILLMSCTLLACRKEEPVELNLPPATNTGKNTLGFLLHDQVWTNYGRRCTLAGCKDNTVTATLHRQVDGNLFLEVSANLTRRRDTLDQAFSFFLQNVSSTGTFIMDSSLQREMVFVANRYAHLYREYKNLHANACLLTIDKFDTVARIISGTFQAVLFNPANHQDNIVISDGRFDAHLQFPR